jgi:class 3 adenylate cyclase
MVNGVILLVLFLAFLVRAYRRSGPREQRQLRWVSFGFYIGLLPYLFFLLALSAGVDLDFVAWQTAADVSLLAIPSGIVISVVAYQYLDIDRLISASASLTTVAIVFVAGLLAAIPWLAGAVSEALGIDLEAGQIALSAGLGAVLVPAYRALRPWIDRRLFAAEHELTERFGRLRAELSACRGVEELATCARTGIDSLLEPDSIATYVRAAEGFTLLFVRGRGAPPAFAAKSALAAVLEAKGAPLFTRTKGIEPFERAALETLGAEVVVPVLRDGQLVAFTCLAGKTSGDIYTATDLERLGSLAERSAEVLARLDLDEAARQSQVIQSALRRYVPGAVAEQVARGEALAPSEREVTVLFVDLRGYTQIAERLHPRDVFATLNEHTERVSGIVQEHGGTIVEFNGDGMMAVFGAPEALARKEQMAVEASRRIVDSMPEALSVGVGVATGEAFVGSIRSVDRLIWTAVGSTTNLASRLQALTRDLHASIAIDETTRERAGYICESFVRHAKLAIRGRTGRFDVYALPLRGAGSSPGR